MYRPEIKVLDCTIRDGGLSNNWDFDEAFVRRVYRALSDAGVDYMEIGYRASKKIFDPAENGPWRFCDEEMIRRVVGDEEPRLKLSCMVDVDRVEPSDILPCEDSLLSMIRVATYVPDIDKAIALASDAIDKGYETTVNIMAISRALERDLDEALEQLAETKVSTVYVVDSFGALYSEQIHYLVDKYARYLNGKEIGIHCHNNQQLAFANTIEAIIRGSNRLDATLYGIGRGAGNCPLELLMSFLKNPKFKIHPILDVISELFIPLREKIEWGYLIPYMITGSLDEHPRSAIKLLAGADRRNFRKFYEQLLDDELA